MNLVLFRQAEAADSLPGWLYTSAGFECYTLELPLSHPEHGKIAIPEGRYALGLYDSPRHGADTLILKDVPGRFYIEVHAGNTEVDTDGCIVVGQRQAPEAVLDSRAALAALRAKVVPILKQGGEVWLTVKDKNETIP